MARRDNRQLLLYTAVFAAPLVVIQLLGGVTSSTEASTPGTPAIPVSNNNGSAQFGPQSLSEAEQRAQAYIQRAADEPFGEFPFVFEPTQQAVVVPVGPRELSVEINAIMSSSSGPTALIDGNLVRVGDVVSQNQWQVASINADARTVIFRDRETGRLVTRTVAPHF